MFRKLILLFIILCICFQVYADVWVNGYTRKDGTRVSGHWRSNPDGIFSNNWSTYGNINPHTGEIGRKTINPNLNTQTSRLNHSSSDILVERITNNSSYTSNSTINSGLLNESLKTRDELIESFSNQTDLINSIKSEYLERDIDKYLTLANKRNKSREENAEMFRLKVEIKKDGGGSRLEEIDNLVREQRKAESQNNEDDTAITTLLFIVLILILLIIPFRKIQK